MKVKELKENPKNPRKITDKIKERRQNFKEESAIVNNPDFFLVVIFENGEALAKFRGKYRLEPHEKYISYTLLIDRISPNNKQ